MKLIKSIFKKNYYYKRNIIIVNVRCLLSLIVKIYLSGSVYNINALKNVPFGAADEAEAIYTPRVILIKAMNIMVIKEREWVF